jgi:hypothetical protein
VETQLVIGFSGELEKLAFLVMRVLVVISRLDSPVLVRVELILSRIKFVPEANLSSARVQCGRLTPSVPATRLTTSAG